MSKDVTQQRWWKDAVIYALDVERYCDSNGDGVGDFRGVIEKLNHIVSLGVNCIWLSPFYESQNCDNGYDVAEYLQIDARLGSYEDFDELVIKAKSHGINIVIDLVGDHTSTRHPWFEAGRRDPKSRFRDYYYWSDKPLPVSEENGPALSGAVDTVWKYDERAKAYYYHRYYPGEPSLNLNNAEVREELKRAMCFWMSFGIAGYRLDAAMNMIKTPVPSYEKFDDPHDIIRELYSYINHRADNTVVLGEVSVPPEKLADFMDGKQFNMLFNFLLNAKTFLALATATAAPIYEALSILPTGTPNCSWANFLRHFDELDLSLLSEDEKQTVFKIFAPDEDMKIFGRGIRRRTAPMLQTLQRLKMAYSLMFACPGAPVIVYGDEIGMGEDLVRRNRQSVRAPMQWTGGRNGGFSDADKEKLVQPMIDSGAYGFKSVNTENQKGDDSSMLAHIKTLVALRRSLPVIRPENLSLLQDISPQIVAFQYKDAKETLITLHNLSDQSVEMKLNIAGEYKNLFGGEKDGMQVCKLDAYGFAWLSDR